MDLVERVAKALCALDGDCNCWGAEYKCGSAYRELARAAIAEVLDAMGTVSDGVFSAGSDALDPRCSFECSPGNVWQAMLAQFRKESGL